MEEYNYEMAQKYCQRALEIDADNVRALEACASLLLEVSLKNIQKYLSENQSTSVDFFTSGLVTTVQFLRTKLAKLQLTFIKQKTELFSISVLHSDQRNT